MYYSIQPSAPLQTCIRCFWALEERPSNKIAPQVITPDSYLELIFNLGAPCYIDDSLTETLPLVSLIGLRTTPLRLWTSGLTCVIGVRFYAWGILPFETLNLIQSENTIVSLCGFWEAIAGQLGEHVYTNDYGGALTCLQNVLLMQYQTAPRDIGLIRRVADTLYTTNDALRISDIAAANGLSVRQLERLFGELLSVSPKLLARMIRFERVSHALYSAPEVSLRAMAFEYGYSDQAHFIHDFKAFAGQTPGAFADWARLHPPE